MKNKNSILYIIIGILLVGLFFVFLTNTNSNKAPVVTTTTQDPNINTPTTINTKTQTQPVYFKGSDFLVLTKEDMLLLLQQGSTSSSRNEGLKSLSVGGAMTDAAPAPVVMESSYDSATGTFQDYSGTNVQVEGIDEGDIVKTNGDKIFIGKDHKLIVINDVNPPLNDIYDLKISKEPKDNRHYLYYTPEETIQTILLDQDLLYLVTTKYHIESKFDNSLLYPQRLSIPTTVVTTYKIKENALEELSKIEIDGLYYQSRLKNGYVYLITNNYNFYYANPILLDDVIINPIIETKAGKVSSTERTVVMPKDGTPENKNMYTVTTLKYSDSKDSVIDSLDLLLDYSSTIYMSENNLYIAHKENQYWGWRLYGYYNNNIDVFKEIYKEVYPSSVKSQIEKNIDDPEKLLEILNDYYNSLDEDKKEDLYDDIQDATENYYQKKQKEREKTFINKIELKADGKLGDITTGFVQGNLLNQFSLDEDKDGYLRVAITYRNEDYKNENAIVILDSSLEMYSELDSLAEDESIYSVRFMGDKVYLVTFRQMDPFFVIDLSDRKHPEVLGFLKIPGYSNYLHPISDTLILGVGQDTKTNKWGGVSQAGVKVSLFDVSDYKDPKEVSTFVVDTDNSYTPIQNDHKAFLYIEKNNLVVIPVNEYYNTREPGMNFYVLELTENDIVEKEIINHKNSQSWYSGILRSLYIGDELYTISDNQLVTYNFETEDKTKVSLN
ncbi:MAG TPA: beta-propeller domain-containing protein [Candidatus Diapherotrites archaeon]|nr:beta-propeller domain-containing protein [Candidatus Diapherotrites archaeon]